MEGCIYVLLSKSVESPRCFPCSQERLKFQTVATLVGNTWASFSGSSGSQLSFATESPHSCGVQHSAKVSGAFPISYFGITLMWLLSFSPQFSLYYLLSPSWTIAPCTCACFLVTLHQGSEEVPLEQNCMNLDVNEWVSLLSITDFTPVSVYIYALSVALK